MKVLAVLVLALCLSGAVAQKKKGGKGDADAEALPPVTQMGGVGPVADPLALGAVPPFGGDFTSNSLPPYQMLVRCLCGRGAAFGLSK